MLKLAGTVIVIAGAAIGLVLAIEFYELLQATTNLFDALADYLRAKA